MNSERIGKYVREQREKAGLSQSELAALLLVGPETVDDWERGVSVPDTSLLLPLAGILGVSVEDVLDAGEPSFDPILTPEPEIGEPRAESAPPTAATASDEIAALPTVLPPEGSALASGAKKLSFSDYFSSKKIKKTSRAYFGEEHEWKIKRKFLRSGTFRRHSRNEFDRAVTQGMFKNDPSHKNGIAPPFLYFYLLLVCFFCFTLSIWIDPAIGFIFSSSMVVLPALVFVYEIEFPRTIGLLRAVFIFLVGGMASILVALFFNLFGFFLSDVALLILAGPIEEFAKAALVIAAVLILKPRHVLTGLLIGFSIGAGFTVFENIMYSSNSYITDIVTVLTEENEAIGDAVRAAGWSAVLTGLIRSVTDIFIGHHYWAAIYGGALVLCKRDEPLSGKHIFNRNVLIVFFICVALHTAFNALTLLGLPGVLIALAVVGFFTLFFFARIRNVGLHQFEVSEAYGARGARE